MGILGGMMKRHEPTLDYRTIDGGHPAPYPDMTDEQLYNYESAFDIRPRTFSEPPRPRAPSAPAAAPERAGAEQTRPVRQKERLRRSVIFDAPRYVARRGAAPAQAATLDFSKPVRTITTKQPVDIITTRARHPVYKVQGYIGDDDVLTVFTMDGRLCENGPVFLENVPEPSRIYLNVYPNGDAASRERFRITQHDSREDADAQAQPGRLACVPLEIVR